MNLTLKKRFYRRTEYLPIGSSEHEQLIRRIHDYSSLFAKLIAHCAVEVFNETKIVFKYIERYHTDKDVSLDSP